MPRGSGSGFGEWSTGKRRSRPPDVEWPDGPTQQELEEAAEKKQKEEAQQINYRYWIIVDVDSCAYGKPDSRIPTRGTKDNGYIRNDRGVHFREAVFDTIDRENFNARSYFRRFFGVEDEEVDWIQGHYGTVNYQCWRVHGLPLSPTLAEHDYHYLEPSDTLRSVYDLLQIFRDVRDGVAKFYGCQEREISWL